MMRFAAVFLMFLVDAWPAASSAESAPYVLQPGHMELEIGPDGNTVILDAPEGLVVIDTGRHPAHAQAILDYAKAAGKRVAAVVNTHWHLDHTTGNRDVLRAYPEARLVATAAIEGALSGFLAPSLANSRQRAADPALTAEARARAARTLTVLEDRATLVPSDPVVGDGPVEIAGRRFELYVESSAATEADLWLVAPDEGLAVVGDLVVAPVPFFDTGCEEGWRRALAAIGATDWNILVPGHGAPMTRDDFDRWRGAFESWLDCAASLHPARECADTWMRDAEGFYTPDEAVSARMLAEAYVGETLRKPANERMAYCAAKN